MKSYMNQIKDLLPKEFKQSKLNSEVDIKIV